MKSPQLLAAGTATINMTPMIDVVFLLIIFFLVSSHLAKQENSLRLNLPVAQSALDDEIERSTVVVNIVSSGQWQLGGSIVDDTMLRNKILSRAMAATEPLRLKIRTDESVRYERIEPILRVASANGIGDIVFSVYEDRGQ